MSLLNRILHATVQRRRPGAHALYALARSIVRAYNNNDVAITANGEAWLIERVAGLRAGMVAIDVGTNLGEWAQEVLRHPDPARLVAYEAVPSTLEKFRQAITDPRAESIGAALSDRGGTLQIQEYADQPQLASLHADYSARGEVALIDIEARTGDSELERLDIGQVDLLKVDTEGHDHAVLLGFDEALAARRVAVIQFEYNYTTLIAGKSLKMFFDLLEPDYLLCRLLPNGLEACGYHPSLDDFVQANWVAINREMLNPKTVRHFAIQPARGEVGKKLKLQLTLDERLRSLRFD